MGGTLNKQYINRHYAAGLPAAVQKWFWGPFCPGKILESFCS